MRDLQATYRELLALTQARVVIHRGQAEGLEGAAVFSPDRRYRYVLTREIENGKPDHTLVAFVGLNPSTADENTNDRTIRRCIDFAKQWRASILWMLNLSPLVATDPSDLRKAGPEPPSVLRTNNAYVRNAAMGAGTMIVAAWGNHGHLEGRAKTMLKLLQHGGCGRIYCLGQTKLRHPRHPLYLPKDAKPELYRNWRAIR